MSSAYEWGARSLAAAWEKVEDHVGDYERIWDELVLARSRFGDFPMDLFLQLRHEIDPDRPYFVGETSWGIKFVGDARDLASALHATEPGFNGVMAANLQDACEKLEGMVFDVGANLGVLAATMAKTLGGRGQVVAFEPVPEVAKRLCATLALNRLDNVLVVEAAVGAEPRAATFEFADGNSAVSSMQRHDFALCGEWRSIEVEVTTLDAVWEELDRPKVSLIKIDVEGEEPAVLAGAQRLIHSACPSIVFEFTPKVAEQRGFDASAFRGFLPARVEFAAIDECGNHHTFPPAPEDQAQVNVWARAA